MEPYLKEIPDDSCEAEEQVAFPSKCFLNKSDLLQQIMRRSQQKRFLKA